MKRFKHFFRYIRLLKEHKETLLNSRIENNPSGIKYDWVYRLYTVLNLPPNDQQNIKRYGVYYIDNMVKNHVAKMNNFLLKLGILEYVRLDTDNIIQIDEFNVKIVLKFKYLNIKGLFRFLFIWLPITLLVVLLLFIIL